MTTPPFDPDDPRLTAYALGESDEADRHAVETFLAESAEGRAEVEQTRKIASLLAAEYASEHDLYLASRRDDEKPANIVAFSSGRSRDWRRSFVSVLKIAAVATIAASLICLTLRRPHRSEAVTAASAPASLPDRAATPGGIADQISNDGTFAPRDDDHLDSMQASASNNARPEPAAVASVPTAGSAVEVASSDKNAEASAGGQASGTLAKTEVALPPPKGDTRRSAPAAAPPAAVSAPLPAKPLSLEERVAHSVVRIRTATGAFFGGVIVSNDGLILAITSLPESSLQSPCTVLLADERELSAVPKPAESHPGWYWLAINAEGLPAVALAREFPANDPYVLALSVHPQTGNTTFPPILPGGMTVSRRAARVQKEEASQTVENTTFAFNAAGELLVLDQTAERSKIRTDLPDAKERTARSFTSAEIEMLQRAAKRGTHE